MTTAKQVARAGALACLTAGLSINSGDLLAQQSHPDTLVVSHTRSAADQNGASTRATHAPQPDLTPLFAWDFVMKGNVDYVVARAEKGRLQSNKLAKPIVTMSHHQATAGEPPHATTKPLRPAGAGKYVCCVITCADLGEEVAPMLGLQRRDVLELRLPGPFVNAESVALIERTIKRHRLCLVLILSHQRCDSLRAHESGSGDALDRRIAKLRGHADRLQRSLIDVMARKQREQILASSSTLQSHIRKGLLRIVPGTIHEETGAIAWQHRSAQALPLSPIK
jgi:hypothetical protein